MVGGRLVAPRSERWGQGACWEHLIPHSQFASAGIPLQLLLCQYPTWIAHFLYDYPEMEKGPFVFRASVARWS